MTTNDKIRDEKLQYYINRKAAKISALSPGKIDKYKYLSDDEILPSNQRHIIEQVYFAYSPLGKVFLKNQGEKKIKALRKRVEKKVLGTDQKSIAFKRFSKWRSYIWIEQNCKNGKQTQYRWFNL